MKVIKKARYWIFCPECKKMRDLESLEEEPRTSETSSLLCQCGYMFPIDKVWTFYDERPCLMDLELKGIRYK